MGTPVHRQHGGRVVPGKTYIINEAARETVTFDQPGTVHPASLTPAGSDGPAIDYGAFSAAVSNAVVAALEGMGIYLDKDKVGQLTYRAQRQHAKAYAGRR